MIISILVVNSSRQLQPRQTILLQPALFKANPSISVSFHELSARCSTTATENAALSRAWAAPAFGAKLARRLYKCAVFGIWRFELYKTMYDFCLVFYL